MNNFFTFCPLFKHFAQMGSELPRWGFFVRHAVTVSSVHAVKLL